MSEPFLGEIRAVGFNFAPNGWFLCNGQLLQISQYQALFALLGTTYGGNGVQTFGLPNLQGRVVVGTGSGAGLPTYAWGQVGGSASVTLTAANLPAHTHPYSDYVSSALADQTDPTGAIPAQSNPGGRGATATASYTKTASTGTGVAQQTGPSQGGGTPVSIEPPYLSVYYIIAWTGIFPSRP
jgi:microcystin-dependent protein